MGKDERGSTLLTQRNFLPRPPTLDRGVLVTLPNLPSQGGTFWQYPISGTYWERIIGFVATVQTDAVAGDRQFVAAYFDGDANPYVAVPLSQGFGPSQLVQVSGSIDAGGFLQVGGQSFPAEGRVLGPAATTILCSAALSGGEYTVNWSVQLDGTTAAVEENNFGLYIGTTLQATSENPSAVGGPYPQPPVTVEIPFAGATLSIKNIAAGTGTAGYTGAFTATPAGNVTAYGRLPDIILQSGWKFRLELINGDVGDTTGPVNLMVERIASNYANGAATAEWERWVESELEEARSYRS